MFGFFYLCPSTFLKGDIYTNFASHSSLVPFTVHVGVRCLPYHKQRCKKFLLWYVPHVGVTCHWATRKRFHDHPFPRRSRRATASSYSRADWNGFCFLFLFVSCDSVFFSWKSATTLLTPLHPSPIIGYLMANKTPHRVVHQSINGNHLCVFISTVCDLYQRAWILFSSVLSICTLSW